MDRDDARMVALILAGHDQCPRAGILQSGRPGMPPASYGFEGEQLVVGGHRFGLAELRGALARLRAMVAAADAQMDLFEVAA